MRFLPLLFVFAFSFHVVADPAADRAALLDGVPSIRTDGVPGDVLALGAESLALIAGQAGKTTLLPVAAAARWEKGRIVALAHNNFLSPAADAGTARLLVNAARWVAPGAQPKIAVRKKDALLAHLRAAGFAAEPLDAPDWTARLSGFAGLCVDAHVLEAKEVAPLAQWIRAGGGLVTAATGWGWAQTHPQQDLASDFPGNQLLRSAGLAWGTSTPDPTEGKAFAVSAVDLSLLNATTAVNALADRQVATAQGAQITTTLTHALRLLPLDDTTILPKLRALHSLPEAREFPRPDRPLAADQTAARLAIAQTVELMKKTPPEKMQAHPAAEFFPGAVPAQAPRGKEQRVTIDTAVHGWHSTGLYAAPGELIRVTAPPELVGKGVRVRIGCHSDALWHHEKWQRVPEITLTFPIEQRETVAANPFGGPLYVELSRSLGAGSATVTISGAVEAPRFILGKTSLEDWRARICKLPAPWTELETRKIIWSVPSSRIRSLHDPEALMKFWDEIMDAQADLAAIPHDRPRPERITADTQISHGYMHAGYPIMVPLDESTECALTLTRLREGSWGHFHELGHNHQVRDWTFDGTTEVTCNLFSLYCMETLCGKPPGQGHDAMTPAAVEKRLRTYWAMGDKFARWKSDPFLALIMYHQLRVGFGWETYKKVFAEYRDLPPAQRPRTDDERRDQWLVRFSRAAGKNLGPFFEKWGVPTSAAARDSIKDLPVWMPDELRAP